MKGAVAAAVLSAIPKPSEAFLGRGGGIISSGLPSQPVPAAAFGFNTLTFWDDFLSLSTIDVNNTLNPGYNWYVKNIENRVQSAASCAINTSSILTFTPDSTASPGGGWLCTPGYTGVTGSRKVGQTIAATGGYFEISMGFNPLSLGTGWWPAFGWTTLQES